MSSDDGKRLHSLSGRGSNSNKLLFKALPPGCRLSLAEKCELRQFVASLGEQVAGNGNFNCLLTNDRELRRLNTFFLGHDYPTDVLSFPSAGGNGELGEIAISLERAEKQANEFGHGRLDEVRILMLHGVLHLAGFDHETDRGEMVRAERKWRGVFGLPTTLLSRQRMVGEARKQ